MSKYEFFRDKANNHAQYAGEENALKAIACAILALAEAVVHLFPPPGEGK